MQKGKVNITMDKDLIEYAKAYAEEQRTTVSEVFTPFKSKWKQDQEIVLCHDCSACEDETIKFIALGPHDKTYRKK